MCVKNVHESFGGQFCVSSLGSDIPPKAVYEVG